MQASAVLKKGEGRTVKRGGAWIFDNEIAEVRGDFSNGDLVSVVDFDGYPMGTGFINLNSKIRIRMMTRDPEAVVDNAFIRRRVEDAWNYRKAVVDTSSCRVIFGEADHLPGLVVDKYEDVLVAESLALGIDRWKEEILQDLKDLMSADGISIRGMYERSDSKIRMKEGMERRKGFIGSPFDTKVKITENGVLYMTDVENGQKTGFFLDQKENRRAVQNLVRRLSGQGKKIRVLDCFTHTGSFALNAAYGGASEVTGVDASELAVAQARENAALNHLEDRVKFETGDLMELLPRLVEAGEQYDVVILDPPAFTKSRATIRRAARGYREINTWGMQLVKPGGYLATCSCSHFMDTDNFRKCIAAAAGLSRREVRQVMFGTQAPDHPFLWDDEESFYLKFYILQVMKSRS